MVNTLEHGPAELFMALAITAQDNYLGCGDILLLCSIV